MEKLIKIKKFGKHKKEIWNFFLKLKYIEIFEKIIKKFK